MLKTLNRKSIIFIVISVICVILLLVLGQDNDKVEPLDRAYESELEEKLCTLISKLDGVSDVKVMVTMECGTEYVYAQDMENNADSERSQYYSAGDEEALLLKEIYPVVRGVAVVCDSVSPAATKATVIELVSSVLGLSANRIFVDT